MDYWTESEKENGYECISCSPLWWLRLGAMAALPSITDQHRTNYHQPEKASTFKIQSVLN